MWRNLKELFRYRTLVGALVQRHLAARYRGSMLGFLWSFLNPLCLMLVYTLVFKYYIRFNEVQNYTVFLFTGLLPWLWVSSGLLEGTNSLIASGHLITKSMFPPQVLPTVAVISSMINFLLSLPLLFLFMAVGAMPFPITMLAVPLLVFLQFLFLLGLVLALSALNVYFRDVQHVVSNVLSLLFFLCPILYPISTVPARFAFTMELNPFALWAKQYHQLVLEGGWGSGSEWVLLSSFALLSFLLGNLIFNRFRESFAEML